MSETKTLPIDSKTPVGALLRHGPSQKVGALVDFNDGEPIVLVEGEISTLSPQWEVVVEKATPRNTQVGDVVRLDGKPDRHVITGWEQAPYQTFKLFLMDPTVDSRDPFTALTVRYIEKMSSFSERARRAADKIKRERAEPEPEPEREDTGNTHYAVVVNLSGGMRQVACGDEGYCTTMLTAWLLNHPLEPYETAEILARPRHIITHR